MVKMQTLTDVIRGSFMLMHAWVRWVDTELHQPSQPECQLHVSLHVCSAYRIQIIPGVKRFQAAALLHAVVIWGSTQRVAC